MNNLRIVTIGYGKLGKNVASAFESQGYHDILIIDPKCGYPWKSLKDVDVAVCATTPDAGDEVVRKVLSEGVDLVVGTTKFYRNADETYNESLLAEYEKLAKENESRMAYAANFSTGANIFWKILRLAGKTMADNRYEPVIMEAHHDKKLDISGTAVVIGKILLECYRPGKTGLQTDDTLWLKGYDNELLNVPYENAPKTQLEREIISQAKNCPPEKIPIISLRYGDIPGTHRVSFIGDTDIINHDHIVTDRGTFGKGAVRLAEWMQDKPPGLYNVDDTV